MRLAQGIRNFYQDIILISLIFIICCFWWLIIFNGFEIPGWYDWPQSMVFREIEGKIILQYHQFPLWNPYIDAGEPWFAHPKSGFFSPYFLLILFFGNITGTLIQHFSHIFIGLLGMYYLSRSYGLNRGLCLLNSVFFLNVFNIVTFCGVTSNLCISLFPWIYLVLSNAKKNNKTRDYLLIALLLGIIIYSGGIYTFIMIFMTIFLDLFLHYIIRRDLSYLLVLLKIALFTFLAGSFKIIPMAGLLLQYPRVLPLPAHAEIPLLERIIHSILQLKYFFSAKEYIYIEKRFAIEEMIGYNFPVLAILLLALSLVFLWKKYRIILIINLFFLFFALGDNSPINIWRLLRHIPGFASFDLGSKLLMNFVFFWSLLLGLILREIYEKVPQLAKTKFMFTLVFIIFILAGVFNCAGRIPVIWRMKPPPYNSADIQRMEFEDRCKNKAVLYGRDDISAQIQDKVFAQGDNEQRGDHFLLNGFGSAERVFFSPNKFKFNLQVERDDILVINQSYFSGWRSSVGKVINQNGLIGVPVAKGCRKITLYYLPLSFIIGAAIFFLWLCVFIFAG